MEFTWNGKKQSIKQWSEDLQVPVRTVYNRIYRGQTIEQALGLALSEPEEERLSEKARSRRLLLALAKEVVKINQEKLLINPLPFLCSQHPTD